MRILVLFSTACSGDRFTASGASCSPASFPEIFEFDAATAVDSTGASGADPGAIPRAWVCSRFGSTSQGRRGAPDDAGNLCKKTTVGQSQSGAAPHPEAVQLSIPFEGLATETVSFAYSFGRYGDPSGVVDLTGRELSGSLRLALPGPAGCVIEASAWATADAQGDANTSYDRVAGRPTALRSFDWVQVKLDLSLSARVDRINQIGIDLSSNCPSISAHSIVPPTVVEIDLVEVTCVDLP